MYLRYKNKLNTWFSPEFTTNSGKSFEYLHIFYMLNFKSAVFEPLLCVLIPSSVSCILTLILLRTCLFSNNSVRSVRTGTNVSISSALNTQGLALSRCLQSLCEWMNICAGVMRSYNKHILGLNRLCDSVTLVGKCVLTYLRPRSSLEGCRVQGHLGKVLGAADQRRVFLGTPPSLG